jgi:hypothetical protein
MSGMSSVARCTCIVVVFVSLVTFITVAPNATDKIKIEKLDDLPRFTYEVGAKPSALLADDEAAAELAGRVKKDVESILATYEIDDANTLQNYYKALQTIAFLDGNYQAAVGYFEKSRALEPKEAKRHMIGLFDLSYIEAVEAGKKPETDEFSAALRENMARRLDAMPWEVVQELVERMNAQMQMIGDELLVGLVQSQLDPAVEKAGFLSGDQAYQVLRYRLAIVVVIPHKEDIAAVLGTAIAAHTAERKKDIWPERSVSFDGSEGYETVVLGVWDSGVDTNVFPGECWTNPNETVDGKDNDHNGYVDDVHGIAYDLNDQKSPDLLYSLGEYASARRDLEDQIKGFMDLGAAIESPEAAQIRKTLAGLEPDEVEEYLDAMSLYDHHSHGTHVAGIALEGNPYGRVLCARHSFDHRMVPAPFTIEKAEAFGRTLGETVQYLKANGTRVVNMSWGFYAKEIEHTLEVNGIGESADEQGKIAREIFAVIRTDLYEAIKGAPEILFVVAAGNEDNDVEFDEGVPASFDLPNLLVSGAVDQAGEPTGFTSFGRTVKVYANGFEVESFVPGGRRLKMSGTSMSSPNVTNLAGKLLARDPSLTPQQVVTLIVDGADDMGKDRPLPVINPKKSMELLESQMSMR